MKKTIGIIGGMGPAATARLFQLIIDHTEAKSDNEHIRIVIDNDTRIPDRTKAILEHSDAPVPYMVHAGKGLAAQGADFLIVPCVTSHYFYNSVQEQLSVPILSMIDVVVKKCAALGLRSVGILATTGTCNTKIFDAKMKEKGIAVLYPNEEEQRLVMDIIYNQVKAGKPIHTEFLKPCLERMYEEGAQSFILGCTELPLAFRNGDYGYSYIDVLEALAEAAVIKSNYQFRK